MRAVTRAWAWTAGGAAAAVALLASMSAAPAAAQTRPASPGDARRIVSLSSAVTEILFAIGTGSEVVAVAQGTTHPAAAAALPHVGPARTVSAEPVLAFRPTLVLADTTIPAATVKQLRSAGVAVELLPGDAAANVTGRVRQVGRLVGAVPRANALADALARELSALAMQPRLPVRVLFIYARGSTTAFVSGRGTGAHEMLQLAGVSNAADSFEGYRPMTAEAVAAAAPDVIVVPARGLASVGGVPALLKMPGVALTPAGRASRIVPFDDQLLLAFGPRTPLAGREMRAAIRDAAETSGPTGRGAR